MGVPLVGDRRRAARRRIHGATVPLPVFGVASAEAVAKAYMGDVISLVLGSFILALAIEHYQIDRRLSLNVRAPSPPSRSSS
jgi:hypothetical protein